MLSPGGWSRRRFLLFACLYLAMWSCVSTVKASTSDGEETADDVDSFIEEDSVTVSDDIVVTERTDPCETKRCGRYQECRVVLNTPNGDMSAVCVCQARCRKRHKPVCGSDGRRYVNHCELHRHACESKQHIRIDHTHACFVAARKNVTTSTTTSTTTVAPSPPDEEDTEEEETPDCTQQEYDFMKENLLLYNSAKLTDGKKNGNDYLVSAMFTHYDENNDGSLSAAELWKSGDKLTPLSSACILADMLLFDDPDRDGTLSVTEFYNAFSRLYSVSVVSLEKALEVNRVQARVGDNVEIKCDVTGTPPPPIVWRRNEVDLAALAEDDIKVFVDGSLYLTNVQLVHAGNYTCHAQQNKEVLQTHILRVTTLPQVRVVPKIQSRAPGELAEMECHVSGVPLPKVSWLKNDEALKMGPAQDKYTIVGNGTALLVGKITYSDTGAYMCVASNPAGASRDISSLVVQDEPAPTPPSEERRFFAFHDWGISVYDPVNCRLHHNVESVSIIPGTQEALCGEPGHPCSWGRAINVADRYVYVSQPTKGRVLVISRVQMVVVDVVVTDKYPVELHYVPHLDQVWVLCWRSPVNKGKKTIQIIRDASQKKKHHTVHPEPVDGHFDLVSALFIPPLQDLGYPWRYGYVVHSDQRGMYKMDLRAMKYVKTVDLTPYDCMPRSAAFASLGGYVILECAEPVTNRPTGQIVLDYLTDTVVSHRSALLGQPHVSPDSQHVVTLQMPPFVKHSGEHNESDASVIIVVQEVKDDGLRFVFDVKTTLRLSAVAFFPSRTSHSYDVYASAANKDDILMINLQDGKVEMITGMGRAIDPLVAEWGNSNRPIASAGVFGTYMVTGASQALFVLNGKTRTVNCECGSIVHPRLMVWVRAQP